MKTTISFATLALINNVSAIDVQNAAIPDGYTVHYESLENSIKDKHTKAETARATAVKDQAGYDEWRAGFTPSSGPVVLN